MAFKDRMKEARLKKHLTQEQLSKKIGVAKSTLAGYEGGNREPSMLTVSKIMDALEVDANFLWQDEMENNFPEKVSYDELEIIEKYRLLDNYGKETIRYLLNRELDRQTQINHYHNGADDHSMSNHCNSTSENASDNVIFIDTYTQSASAGTGQYLDDDSFQKLGYPANRVPANTDFAVPVAGDSMEPEYSDGDIVFVERSEDVAFGDIGLFVLNGEGFIKMCDPKGLVSLNPAYSPIKINDDCSFKTIGKILGKL